MRIARVFPRRTKATPIDELAFTDEPGLFPIDVDEVRVSVTFTWDLPRAEYLAKAWERVAPVSIGGPATGMRGENFTPGMYLKPGYVITSRGCPNRCWFCSVWKREGQEVRELPITDGFNVLDDNLLACSEAHVRAVFAMLKRQPRRAKFTGGLEAARLQPWHVDLLADLRPETMFFAYDEQADYEPLERAAGLLREAGIKKPCLRCFVLCGYKDDTIEDAERRLRQTCELGFDPQAMLFQHGKRERDIHWMRFVRLWSRPASIHAMLKEDR